MWCGAERGIPRIDVYMLFLGHFYGRHCAAELFIQNKRAILSHYFIWWIERRADAQSKFNSMLSFPFVEMPEKVQENMFDLVCVCVCVMRTVASVRTEPENGVNRGK